MLRDGWNFHGDIAIVLEGYAHALFEYDGRPLETIFDADVISQYSFAEVMIILIRKKTNYSNEYKKVDEFVSKCSRYIGIPASSIHNETAQELYNEFIDLFNK